MRERVPNGCLICAHSVFAGLAHKGACFWFGSGTVIKERTAVVNEDTLQRVDLTDVTRYEARLGFVRFNKGAFVKSCNF